VTLKGFKKCCKSNIVNETNDDMLWNGSEEDGNVRGVCVCVCVRARVRTLVCEGQDSDADW